MDINTEREELCWALRTFYTLNSRIKLNQVCLDEFSARKEEGKHLDECWEDNRPIS